MNEPKRLPKPQRARKTPNVIHPYRDDSGEEWGLAFAVACAIIVLILSGALVLWMV